MKICVLDKKKKRNNTIGSKLYYFVVNYKK